MTGSLLDTAGCKTVEWWVVYHERPAFHWWGRKLHPQFRHVELAREWRFGPGLLDVMWLQMIPTYETLDVDLCTDPSPPWVRCPKSTCQKVTSVRKLDSIRSWFDIGPFTCVEAVKVALGIRAFWVRTPYQLFKYIQRRNGVIKD